MSQHFLVLVGYGQPQPEQSTKPAPAFGLYRKIWRNAFNKDLTQFYVSIALMITFFLNISE
jgi:hypothetical protein